MCADPLAIDLFCGLGGWTEGLLDEGYRVVGFDNERHVYGEARYPGQLVIQDVLTLHGRQFKDAALIVASPPCQAYSYRAMPWKRAKALPPPDNTLFEACFRIQREAIEAAGRFIPLVVENVCGAQKWVGRARWHYGSFYLWGDVPALMPITRRGVKVGGIDFNDFKNGKGPSKAFNDVRHAAYAGMGDGIKAGDRNKARATGGHEWTTGFDKHAELDALHKRRHSSDFLGVKLADTIENAADGCKQRGSGAAWWRGEVGSKSSKSSARKAASAHIAKIPYELSRHIGRAWWPERAERLA